jgi:predicted XRE-type DNA-binding protein
MLVKAQLVTKISDIIRKRRLTQVQAAGILGLTQPKVSGLLKGQFRGVSERRLLDCLTRAWAAMSRLWSSARHGIAMLGA